MAVQLLPDHFISFQKQEGSSPEGKAHSSTDFIYDLGSTCAKTIHNHTQGGVAAHVVRMSDGTFRCVVIAADSSAKKEYNLSFSEQVTVWIARIGYFFFKAWLNVPKQNFTLAPNFAPLTAKPVPKPSQKEGNSKQQDLEKQLLTLETKISRYQGELERLEQLKRSGITQNNSQSLQSRLAALPWKGAASFTDDHLGLRKPQPFTAGSECAYRLSTAYTTPMKRAKAVSFLPRTPDRTPVSERKRLKLMCVHEVNETALNSLAFALKAAGDVQNSAKANLEGLSHEVEKAQASQAQSEADLEQAKGKISAYEEKLKELEKLEADLQSAQSSLLEAQIAAQAAEELAIESDTYLLNLAQQLEVQGLDAIGAAIKDLQEKCSAAALNATKKSEELESTKSSLAEAEQRLEEARLASESELKQLNDQLTMKEQEAQSLTASVDEQKAQLAAVEEEKDALAAEIEGRPTEGELGQVQQEAKQTEDELQELRKQLQAKEQEAQRLTVSVDEQKRQLAALKEAKTHLEAEVEKLPTHEKFEEVLQAAKSSGQTLEGLSKQYAEKEEEVQRLTASVDEQKAQLAAVEEEKDALATRVSQLPTQDEVASLQKELEEAQEEALQAEARRAEELEKVQELEAELGQRMEKLEAEVQQKALENKELEKRKKDLQVQLDAAVITAKTAQESVKRLSQEIEQGNAQSEETLAQQQESLKVAEEKSKLASEKVIELESFLHQLQSQIAASYGTIFKELHQLIAAYPEHKPILESAGVVLREGSIEEVSLAEGEDITVKACTMIEGLRKMVEALSSALHAAEEKVMLQAQTGQSLVEQLQAASQQYSNLELEFGKLQATKSELEATNAGLVGRLTHLEGKDGKGGEIARLQAQAQEIQAQAEEALAKLREELETAHAQKVEELKAAQLQQVEELAKKIQSMEKELLGTQTDLASAVDTVQNQDAELQKIAVHCEHLAVHCEHLKAAAEEHSRLRYQLQDNYFSKISENGELNQRLVEMKHGLQFSEDKIRALTAQLKEKKLQVAELEYNQAEMDAAVSAVALETEKQLADLRSKKSTVTGKAKTEKNLEDSHKILMESLKHDSRTLSSHATTPAKEARGRWEKLKSSWANSEDQASTTESFLSPQYRSVKFRILTPCPQPDTLVNQRQAQTDRVPSRKGAASTPGSAKFPQGILKSGVNDPATKVLSFSTPPSSRNSTEGNASTPSSEGFSSPTSVTPTATSSTTPPFSNSSKNSPGSSGGGRRGGRSSGTPQTQGGKGSKEGSTKRADTTHRTPPPTNGRRRRSTAAAENK